MSPSRDRRGYPVGAQVSDLATRSAIGESFQAQTTGLSAPIAATLLEASWRDFVFAEVWSRPALDLRSRFLISLGSAACAGDQAACRNYARGSLAGALSLAELREAALHVAVYGGWTAGTLLDAGISAASTELGLDRAEIPPICAEGLAPAKRLQTGADSFREHMLFGGPPPATAYFEAGILNFVFGEMWNRPGLDQRSRRWLTLVGVGFSGASTPIRSHVWSAMASGNASRTEMNEFVLQYAIHAGWPRGSAMQAAVLEQAVRIDQNLPFEA